LGGAEGGWVGGVWWVGWGGDLCGSFDCTGDAICRRVCYPPSHPASQSAAPYTFGLIISGDINAAGARVAGA
jgi:hypothetical protein